MAREWIHEQPAVWDEHKERIIRAAPTGTFDSRLMECERGALVPSEWWRVEDDGAVVGYGWMDVNWGDAEILLATSPDARGQGVGRFILERLEGEARNRGLRYLTNMVRPTHPDADAVTRWLKEHGFEPSGDGRLSRAVVKVDGA